MAAKKLAKKGVQPEALGEPLLVEIHEGNGNGSQDGQQVVRRSIPSTSDMLIQPGGGGNQWNNAKEMLTGSLRPEEYLPRTRISEQEIARLKRIMCMLNRAQYGHTDLAQVLWTGYQARIGLNGEGRKEAVEIMIAQNRQVQQRQGMLNRMRAGNGGNDREMVA